MEWGRHSWPHLWLYILVIITAHWRWPQWRPKHVGENLVYKIYHKLWSSLSWFCIYTGLFKMIVGVLTTCHKTWDRSVCIFLFNTTTLLVFVTYLTGALYVHPLWFYKHQHVNRFHSKLSVACQWWWFQWRFWFVPSVPRYTRTLSLETVHNILEWNCHMVDVPRIWWGTVAGQFYPDNHFE